MASENQGVDEVVVLRAEDTFETEHVPSKHWSQLIEGHSAPGKLLLGLSCFLNRDH